MLSGTRSNLINEHRAFLEVNSVIHPRHGPVHPRRPDTIMKIMIRGMLPRKKPSGVAAHKRLRTYIGSPKELGAFKKIQFENAKITRSSANYTTVGEIGKIIGWTE
jgi:large subunit ribosomal protein L13